jgi:hypothetical protein
MRAGTVHPKEWQTRWPRGWRAMQLLVQAGERAGCGDVRALAAALGVEFGPGLLPAVGYSGDPPLAWLEFLVLYNRGMAWLADA